MLRGASRTRYRSWTTSGTTQRRARGQVLSAAGEARWSAPSGRCGRKRRCKPAMSTRSCGSWSRPCQLRMGAKRAFFFYFYAKPDSVLRSNAEIKRLRRRPTDYSYGLRTPLTNVYDVRKASNPLYTYSLLRLRCSQVTTSRRSREARTPGALI